ncbi:MAG: acyl-CoA thioesterase/BAAT N-terminal domain-containing protein [Gammaproteobacteria bacterium]|nr:acyl-CoA thioesterase/BAAT N-terminal domain-containing protein [Gammaproteobacteria bacterium]
MPEAWDPPSPPAPLSETPGKFALDIQPLRAVIDQPVEIKVRGVAANETVVMRAWTEGASGLRFESWARFVADKQGIVDTAVLAPLEGTYRDADGSGLLWSMRAPDAEVYESSSMPQARYYVSAETTNGVVEVALTRINPRFQILSQTISTEFVDGQFWLPESAETLPAVIRLHGSEGAFNPTRSALLASSGFAVLDLRFVDPVGLPEIVAVPVETVQRGIDWLVQHPRVDAARIGIYGGSKGAELALYAAAKDPRIRAVVAWSPASHAFEGVSFRELTPGSSWSWQGNPTAYAPFRIEGSEVLRHLIRLLFRNVSMLPIYERTLNLAPPESAIQVEEISGAILLLAGRDDRMWPSARMAAILDERLTDNHHPNHEIVLYDNTGHRMRYALWPDLHQPSRIVGGGRPEQNHASGRDAWRRIKEFLRRELR